MKVKSRDQLDNLICTVIKIYPLNLTYAFRRASQLTGVPISAIANRYYSVLRHERQIFCVKTEEVEIWNQKRMGKDEYEIDKLKDRDWGLDDAQGEQ